MTVICLLHASAHARAPIHQHAGRSWFESEPASGPSACGRCGGRECIRQTCRTIAWLMTLKAPAAANTWLHHFWEASNVLACRPHGPLHTSNCKSTHACTASYMATSQCEIHGSMCSHMHNTPQLVQQRKRGAHQRRSRRGERLRRCSCRGERGDDEPWPRHALTGLQRHAHRPAVRLRADAGRHAHRACA